jgi:thioredoxin 1
VIVRRDGATPGMATGSHALHTGTLDPLTRAAHDEEELSVMATGIVNLSTATFEESVNASTAPVVVDFWAEWCGPCKMITPILEELAGELGEQVTIAKLNVDDNPDVAMRYNVMSIPTLLVFQDGEVKKRLVGAKGKGQLLQELDEFLATSR